MRFAVVLQLLVLAVGLSSAAALAQSPQAGDDWQVVLLKPRDCNACSLLEESLKRQGSLQRVPLADGAGTAVSAAIQRRAIAEVPASDWDELQGLPYVDARAWGQQAAAGSAQVLLKHNGHVVSAGAIDDSVNLRDAEFPLELTMPLSGTSVEAVRSGYAAWYRDFYLRNWSLDYFLRLALNPSLAREQRLETWLARLPKTPTPPPLQSTNVLLMATASGAIDNEIFNAMRIEEIRGRLLEDLAVDPSQLQIFYGGGKQPGPNAVERRDGQLVFIRREIREARPFQLPRLAEVFQSLRGQQASRNLLVFIGHGGPSGVGMWGEPAGLSPTDLAALHRHGGGDDVLVSGSCYGGVMAQAVSCGFFGARPDIIATGCQADAAQVIQSKDYLHVFFDSLSRARRQQTDADGDGDVSFEEAHWQATVNGDPRNITYTTVDSLADEFFRAHPGTLPADVELAEVQRLAEHATAAERSALRDLARDLDGRFRIPLQDLAGQAIRYSLNPEGPRPMLGQLARRLLYTQRLAKGDAALAQAQACGSRSVATFLAR